MMNKSYMNQQIKTKIKPKMELPKRNIDLSETLIKSKRLMQSMSESLDSRYDVASHFPTLSESKYPI